MLDRESRLGKLAAGLLFTLWALMALAAPAYSETYTIGLIKGPSGLGAAWMLDAPPESGDWRIRFSLAASADLIVAKLVSGEIQGGILPVNVAAKLRNSGLDICAAAVVGEGMVQFLTNDAGIRALADLRGREIHIGGQKATPDYVFRSIARKAGLEAQVDYRPVYNLALPEIAAQLALGKISAAVLPEPFATQARILAPSLKSPLDISGLWTETTGQSSYPMTLLVLKNDLVWGAPGPVSSLLASYANSIATTLADPVGTGLLAERLDLGMKASVAAAAIPRSAYVFKSASEARPAIESLLASFLAFEPAGIGGKLPGADFYLRTASPVKP